VTVPDAHLTLKRHESRAVFEVWRLSTAATAAAAAAMQCVASGLGSYMVQRVNKWHG
jgi:hypothetical protein